MDTFQIGDQPLVTGYFIDILTNLPADPTAIVVKVRKPDGSVTAYTQADCTNPAVGTWRFLLPAALDQEGRWAVKFYGTATVIAAGAIQFAVKCDEFGGP